MSFAERAVSLIYGRRRFLAITGTALTSSLLACSPINPESEREPIKDIDEVINKLVDQGHLNAANNLITTTARTSVELAALEATRGNVRTSAALLKLSPDLTQYIKASILREAAYQASVRYTRMADESKDQEQKIINYRIAAASTFFYLNLDKYLDSLKSTSEFIKGDAPKATSSFFQSVAKIDYRQPSNFRPSQSKLD